MPQHPQMHLFCIFLWLPAHDASALWQSLSPVLARAEHVIQCTVGIVVCGSRSQAACCVQVADQVLPDGLDYAEVGNMLRFAASVSDCAPNQLSQDTFDRLVAHLYG